MLLLRNRLAGCRASLLTLLAAHSLMTATRSDGATVNVAWQPNSEPDLAGYLLCYGDSSSTYSRSIDVGDTTRFSVFDLSQGKTYYFAMRAYDSTRNLSAFSEEVAVYVPDLTPPGVSSVNINGEPTVVYIVFDEPVERTSAETAGNYEISEGILVSGASLLSNNRTVRLRTTPHIEGQSYTLTIRGIRDMENPPNLIHDGTSVNYTFNLGLHVSLISSGPFSVAVVHVGEYYYTDREYTVTSVPEYLDRALWIKTANDLKDDNAEAHLVFQLSQPSTVYVGYDPRATQAPDWLADNFVRMTDSIGVSDEPGGLALWKKDCDPGRVTLGGNLAEGAAGSKAMYVVLVASRLSSIPSAVDDPQRENPTQSPPTFLTLHQNYPNPFNPSTRIHFDLQREFRVELSVYNMLGMPVKTLVAGHLDAGKHEVVWDGTDGRGRSVASGTYVVRLEAQHEARGGGPAATLHRQSRLMTLMR